MIEIIKEFVRIGRFKSFTEILNSTYIKYDDATIQYDQDNIKYLNFLISTKPNISKL